MANFSTKLSAVLLVVAVAVAVAVFAIDVQARSKTLDDVRKLQLKRKPTRRTGRRADGWTGVAKRDCASCLFDLAGCLACWFVGCLAGWRVGQQIAATRNGFLASDLFGSPC